MILNLGKTPRNLLTGIESVMAEQRDHYEVLGVAKTATSQQINSAYLKISAKNHPDRMPIDATEAYKKACEATFIEATKAKDVLMDAKKREAYDRGGHSAVESLANGNGTNPGSSVTTSNMRIRRDLSDEGLKKFFGDKSKGNGSGTSFTPPSNSNASERPAGVQSMEERFARRERRPVVTTTGSEAPVVSESTTPVVDATAQSVVSQASTALDKVSTLSVDALATLPVAVLQQLSQKLDAAKTKTGTAVTRAQTKGGPGL
jgi:curved DNA-binding protein CbpA